MGWRSSLSSQILTLVRNFSQQCRKSPPAISYETRSVHRGVLLSSKWLTITAQLREGLGLPIPRTCTSSLTSFNVVGAEYIIEQKACDTSLGSLWYQWPKETQIQLVSQIVDLEKKLTSISFPKHGCLYFKADLESRDLATECLLP